MSENYLKLVEARRAIKEFDNEHVLPEEDLNKILTAVHFTPTAYNLQNYRFVVVQDKEVRHSDDFMAAGWNQPKMATSSALIILCADKDSWRKDARRVWESAGKDVQDTMEGMITSYYEGNERVQLDEAHRSCGMAGMNIMLTAQALGYDTCPMDGFDYEAMGKQINLPEDHVISFIIAIGKRTADPFPRATLLPKDEIVIHEKFAA